MAGVLNTSAMKAEVVGWDQATRDNLQPFAHGVYVNQLGDTMTNWSARAMGRTLAPRGDEKKVRPKQRAATQPKRQGPAAPRTLKDQCLRRGGRIVGNPSLIGKVRFARDMSGKCGCNLPVSQDGQDIWLARSSPRV